MAGQSNGATAAQTVYQLCLSINSSLPNQLPSVSSAVSAICGSATTRVLSGLSKATLLLLITPVVH